MHEKLRKILFEVCEIMDLVMAFAVAVGIVIAAIGVFPVLAELWEHKQDVELFSEFLDTVLSVIIGVEFLKMLCKPSSANIIETLIFLIARHMIVMTTTAQEDLISVIGICILFVFRRLMLATKPDKEHKAANIFKAIQIAQSPEFQRAMKELDEKETESMAHQK